MAGFINHWPTEQQADQVSLPVHTGFVEDAFELATYRLHADMMHFGNLIYIPSVSDSDGHFGLALGQVVNLHQGINGNRSRFLRISEINRYLGMANHAQLGKVTRCSRHH